MALQVSALNGRTLTVLVIGARGEKLPAGTPGHTVNRAFMVFNTLEANLRLFYWILSARQEEKNVRRHSEECSSF